MLWLLNVFAPTSLNTPYCECSVNTTVISPDMNVSFNPSIPGLATGSSGPIVVTRSRRFLILLTAILSLSFCSLMFSALVGTERYLVFVADYGLASIAILACTVLGICGAVGGSFSSIILLTVRRS